MSSDEVSLHFYRKRFMYLFIYLFVVVQLVRCSPCAYKIVGLSPCCGMQELDTSSLNHCLIPPRCDGYLAIGGDGIYCRVLKSEAPNRLHARCILPGEMRKTQA